MREQETLKEQWEQLQEQLEQMEQQIAEQQAQLEQAIQIREKLEQAILLLETQMQEAQESVRRCPACQAPMNPGARFCVNCGTAVRE